MAEEKAAVRDFWDSASCGEIYAEGVDARASLRAQASTRYQLEPYIPGFAKFEEGKGRRVLEIGVGMGADHERWAVTRPSLLVGLDFTPRAVGWTRQRLESEGFEARLMVADAENLPFPEGAFDLVYAWGVFHHSPDTARAFAEVHRVLAPGGRARVMVYQRKSIVGYLLWVRFALLAGRPRTPLDEIYARFLESPGTKAYTPEQARRLTSEFTTIDLRVELSPGDLLEGEVGQRHQGTPLSLAKRMWPRPAIRRFLGRYGLFLLIEATK